MNGCHDRTSDKANHSGVRRSQRPADRSNFPNDGSDHRSNADLNPSSDVDRPAQEPSERSPNRYTYPLNDTHADTPRNSETQYHRLPGDTQCNSDTNDDGFGTASDCYD